MSDGGAAVIVEVASPLVQTKAGRVALVVIAAYLALQYALEAIHDVLPVVLAVLAAALLGLGALALLRRRERRRRASMWQAVALAGAVLVACAAALFLIARRRREAAAPLPSQEQVDRLAWAEEG